MIQFSFPISGVRRVCVTLAVATSALLASATYAQHDHAATVQPTTSALPLKFDSVISRYKPMADQELGSWREANDTVTQIGGWRTYLKESRAPEAMTPASPAMTTKPAMPMKATGANPHAGHGAKP